MALPQDWIANIRIIIVTAETIKMAPIMKNMAPVPIQPMKTAPGIPLHLLQKII